MHDDYNRLEKVPYPNTSSQDQVASPDAVTNQCKPRVIFVCGSNGNPEFCMHGGCFPGKKTCRFSSKHRGIFLCVSREAHIDSGVVAQET
jgi:hypothetical protein